MYRVLFILLISTISNNAIADAKTFYSQRLTKELPLTAQPLATVSAQTYQQSVDHNGQDLLFSQRYYQDDTFAKGKNSPVLLYICGESVCHPSSLKGAIAEHAKKIGAYLVSLEHRFYGESRPFPTMTTANLKYLTVDLALKDLNAFQKWFTKKNELTGKWIAIGGSYPGNLAAYYRLKYPESVVGALASSAPVKAKEDFEEYDEHVGKVSGAACVASMKRTFAIIESAKNDPVKLKKIKTKFNANEIDTFDDFLYFVTDVSAAAIQYGSKDQFCQAIQAQKNINAYAAFAKKFMSNWGISAVDFTSQSAISTEYPSGDSFGMRAWLWQSCTEYGYWQVAHSDPALRVRSEMMDLAFHRRACKKLFGLTTPVNTSKSNSTYYQPLLNNHATNILFTNGSNDPWSTLSLLPNHSKGTDLESIIIDQAAHCDDLGPSRASDSSQLKIARKRFSSLISDWLE